MHTFSQSDIKAYAAWQMLFPPEREQRDNLIKDRTFGYDNLCAIDREIYAMKREKAIETFDTTAEIKAHMLAGVRQRGAREPRAVDYTDFLKGALNSKRDGHRALEAYKPEPGASGIKLIPSKAVAFFSSQESYSDDSATAIPYAVNSLLPADKAVFARNVSALVRRANSHNGWAGSGATYEASVHDGFIVVHCRSSIAD